MREGGDGARPVWCRLVQMGAPRVARGRHSQSSTLEQSSAIVTTAWNPVDGLPSSGSPGRRRCHTRFVTIVPDQPSPTSLVFAKSLKQCSLCRPGRSCSILRTISALNLSMHLGDRCFSSSSSDVWQIGETAGSRPPVDTNIRSPVEPLFEWMPTAVRKNTSIRDPMSAWSASGGMLLTTTTTSCASISGPRPRPERAAPDPTTAQLALGKESAFCQEPSPRAGVCIPAVVQYAPPVSSTSWSARGPSAFPACSALGGSRSNNPAFAISSNASNSSSDNGKSALSRSAGVTVDSAFIPTLAASS